MLDKKDIDIICALTELQFSSAESEAYFYSQIKKYSDKDTMSIINFATRWGKCMQFLVDTQGQDFESSAEETQYVCDYEKMSGYTFNLAVRFLKIVWKYGEELRVWYNNKLGYKGDGLINPSIIHIKTKEEDKSL